MRLTAVFETWHLGDENYPPLHRDQLVNLSFEFLPQSLSKSIAPKATKFEQIKDAEYSFEGTVLKVYEDPPHCKVVVVQAGDFRFYINSFPTKSPALKEGDSCGGFGSLFLDHYIWVEFLSTYKDPPDLFYSLRLTRIRAVKASLDREGYSENDTTEIERMELSREEYWSSYLVDFDGSSTGTTKIPLTFHSRTI